MNGSAGISPEAAANAANVICAHMWRELAVIDATLDREFHIQPSSPREAITPADYLELPCTC